MIFSASSPMIIVNLDCCATDNQSAIIYKYEQLQTWLGWIDREFWSLTHELVPDVKTLRSGMHPVCPLLLVQKWSERAIRGIALPPVISTTFTDCRLLNNQSCSLILPQHLCSSKDLKKPSKYQLNSLGQTIWSQFFRLSRSIKKALG